MVKKEESSSGEEKRKETSAALSRRKFIKSAGVIAGGASLTITAGAAAGEGAFDAVGSSAGRAEVQVEATACARKIKLYVNGTEYEVQVDPQESLRDCLREKLGYLSIKDMCLGHGACGSCTVIMDGRPILSCLTLAIECDGRKIETAEGIALSKHALIEAYIMNYCMQCGYCTPGFLCTSKALLDRNPNPTEDDIREALAGNLCRCATYVRHIPAVLQAARELKGA